MRRREPDGVATVRDGRDVLPRFQLRLCDIDDALSQVCFISCNRESYSDHRLSQDSSASESPSDGDMSVVQHVPKPSLVKMSLCYTMTTNMYVEITSVPRKVYLYSRCFLVSRLISFLPSFSSMSIPVFPNYVNPPGFSFHFTTMFPQQPIILQSHRFHDI